MICSSSWLPELFSRAFRPVPDVPISDWADSGHFKLRKSPEPFYRSERTPWVRRSADLVRKPWHNGRRIRRFGAKKCSRSGYTEGSILNPVRWIAAHRPRNCLLSVDSQKEVANIQERLLPTLEDLGQHIFTGDDDDLSKFVLRLHGMDVYFTGSGSAGGFSNKTAPNVFNDEIDLYMEIAQEGDSIENFYSRCKGTDDGFQVVISKPAMCDGPIDSFHKRGNQEQWHIPCPHHGCRERQPLEWDRVVFGHCKDLAGAWDFERLLTETFYRCRKCGQPIHNHHKEGMNAAGDWVPTAKGDPEIITQEISDLYSLYEDSTFGHLAKDFVNATMIGDRRLLQAFRQQRLGLGWQEKIQRIEATDLLKLRRPYRRGVIPEKDCNLLLAVDIGLYVNTRWVIYAFNASGEMWLVDWGGGTGDGPQTAITLMKTKSYPCPKAGTQQGINFAFIDARYRTDEVYETCLISPRQIFPVMGRKRGISPRSISYDQVKDKPEGFRQLMFVDNDAKFDLYIDTIKEGRPPGIYWPEDIDDAIVREHSAERLIQEKYTNRVIFEEKHKRPNHFGDGTKIARTGIDWLLGLRRSRMMSELARPVGETPAENVRPRFEMS